MIEVSHNITPLPCQGDNHSSKSRHHFSLLERNHTKVCCPASSTSPLLLLLGWNQTRPLLPRMIAAPIGSWWKWVLRLFTKLGDTLTRQPWPSLPYLRLLVCILKDPSWKML